MLDKTNRYRNKKITDSARGELCQMRLFKVCNADPETTVWAHSNLPKDGKGAAYKAHDCFGAYMCSACHDEFDGRTNILGLGADAKETIFNDAMKRSWLRLLKRGVIK